MAGNRPKVYFSGNTFSSVTGGAMAVMHATWVMIVVYLGAVQTVWLDSLSKQV